MATFARVLLSGSTNGRVIPVAATATPGTTIHTALAGTTGFDCMHLWVSNITGSAATLTLEWGGVTDPGDHLCHALSIAANSGPILIVDGLMLNNALVLKAFSGTASALNLSGYVNRIS
jgi:hypothetical protein